MIPRLPLSHLLVLALAAASASPALAYKRIKIGPAEFVPTFAFEIRQHSNVYVTSDDSVRSPENPTASVSGIIFDVRPGAVLNLKPRLQQHIRGLYLDIKYAPALVLFPQAPDICGDPPLAPCPQDGATKPDLFKLDHNFTADIRYQISGAISLAGGAEYIQPELSQANVSLTDFVYRAGAKVDFTRTMSASGEARWRRFATPRLRTLIIDGNRVTEEDDSPFGSFDSQSIQGRFSWQLTPTLEVGALYDRNDRQFDALPFAPGQFGPNNFDRDTIPDNEKSYVEQSLQGYATKRLARNARGSAAFGTLRRKTDRRQFGRDTYTSWIGSGRLETLLTKRTRFQASAEYTLTDTFRPITFSDVNAFTTDQTGAFTILPEQFSLSYDQRYLVDLIQNVFRRSDQILLGFGYQRDRLVDQIGSQNFFRPGSAERRVLDDRVCRGFDATTGEVFYCDPVLDNQIRRNLLFTGGYRLKLYRWLGVQLRGTYYRALFKTERTEARLDPSFPSPPATPTIRTHYWSLSGGLVINLQVFQ